MKKVNLYLVLLTMIQFLSCSKTEEIVFPAQIINLSSEGLEGQIKLSWQYSEQSNNIRYVEISYYDYNKGKNVKKLVSGYSCEFIIDDTQEKDGEYTFRLQPFSVTFTPGNVYEIPEISKRAPVKEYFTSKELVLDAEDINIPGIYSSSKPESLFDGNNSTYVNFDYGSDTSGITRYYEIHYPKEQEYLKFSYINRDNSSAKFPSVINCYVKKNEQDEWTLLTTLTLESDKLPVEPLGTFVSKEYKAPFRFNYFKFEVPEIHTGNTIKNFSFAEFRVFDVEYFYYDPEA